VIRDNGRPSSVRSDGYYRRFTGDYQRDTRGLSLAEHGAYNQLLDSYYSEEELPADLPTLYRIAGAMDDLERAAVDKVVKKYFTAQGERLVQERVERELAARREFKANEAAYLEEQSRKGKLGADARWGGKPGPDPPIDPPENPGKMPDGTPPAMAPAIATAITEGLAEGITERCPNDGLASASASRSGSPSGSKDQDHGLPRARAPARFSPPTLQEVSEYCKARGNGVDPVKFHAHYTARGWKMGKTPMKDWQAAVVTWERNDRGIP
jgi:uncharacterized protein YdaU (DUF1376 family)